MGDAADDAERRANNEREEPMSDEVTTHQIQGVCAGTMMKGDWNEYHVDIGKQYPVKLATKQDDIKAAAAAAGSQVAVWTYTERDGNPNPHRPGEFFKNRYLSNVEVGGTLDPALAAQQTIPTTGASTRPGTMPNPEGRDVSIERQVIVKEVLPHLAEFKDQDEMFALMDRLDEWMGRERPKAEGAKPPVAEAAPATETTPPPVDDQDDIPF
jgi:hypothetical protein